MQCYAMLCYAMLCYAMLCYAMLCYGSVDTSWIGMTAENCLIASIFKNPVAASLLCLLQIKLRFVTTGVLVALLLRRMPAETERRRPAIMKK
eukprot:scaffold4118_cov39-Attheya_sp.AAC.1